MSAESPPSISACSLPSPVGSRRCLRPLAQRSPQGFNRHRSDVRDLDGSIFKHRSCCIECLKSSLASERNVRQ